MNINIKKEKKVVAVIFIIFVISLTFLFFNSFVLAADKGVDSALKGLNQSANKGFFDKDDEGNIDEGIITSIPGAIGTVVGAGLAFIGVLFFILIVYGGLLWMTARGNETQVVKAKDLIQSAIIGLIIVLAAYAITAYISELLF